MEFDLATLFPALNPEVRDSRTLIYLLRHGSHAYGTNTASSDLDLRGVAVPCLEDILGPDEDFGQMISAKPVDSTVFSIKKFIKLAKDANPNVLELLFVEPEDMLLVTPAGEALLAARDIFLTKKIQHTFAGYAKSQISRIKTHRRWLINPPTKKPDRKDYGLPERTILPKDQLMAAVSMMTKKVEAWDVDFEGLDPAARLDMIARVGEALAEMGMSLDNRYKAAGKLLGFADNFLQVLDLERKYKSASDEWAHYEEWKAKRNPARAALEEQHGYDTKHAMHLVRLALTCVETLRTGKLKVKRDDAEELLAIRNGKFTYDELFDYAQEVMDQIPDAAAHSPLPDHVDDKAAKDLCVAITSMVGDGGVGFSMAASAAPDETTARAIPRQKRKFKPSTLSGYVLEAITKGNTRAIDIINYVTSINNEYRMSSIRNALTSMKSTGIVGVTGDSCHYRYFIAAVPAAETSV